MEFHFKTSDAETNQEINSVCCAPLEWGLGKVLVLVAVGPNTSLTILSGPE